MWLVCQILVKHVLQTLEDELSEVSVRDLSISKVLGSGGPDVQGYSLQIGDKLLTQRLPDLDEAHINAVLSSRFRLPLCYCRSQ